MRTEGQTLKTSRVRLDAVVEFGPATETADEVKVYHERELRFIAAFRLRDAANRVATLVGMSTSATLRADLLAIYERLMDEERALLVRSMDAMAPKLPPARTGRGVTRRSSP